MKKSPEELQNEPSESASGIVYARAVETCTISDRPQGFQADSAMFKHQYRVGLFIKTACQIRETLL